jgi:TatD DNase family protein
MNNHNAPLIDSHIHLDQYEDNEIEQMIRSFPDTNIQSLITVSMHLASCQRNEHLAQRYSSIVRPAYGYHPEQPLPDAEELQGLLLWIEQRIEQTVAIGEIGLPYYRRLEATERGEELDEKGYIDVLSAFLQLAVRYNKSVILHAVYEDAEIACDLLEQYGITKAHFHWFKGYPATIQRMIANGYHISFTPDIEYEAEIQQLAMQYPPHLVMAETDGPWRFEGSFAGQMTHPAMTANVSYEWAKIQHLSEQQARRLLYQNTLSFYT